MIDPDDRVGVLLDRLIECWDWAGGSRDLQGYVLDISRAPRLFPFTAREQKVVVQLLDVLTPAQWAELPELLNSRPEQLARAKRTADERKERERLAEQERAVKGRLAGLARRQQIAAEQAAREAEVRRLEEASQARERRLEPLRVRLWEAFDSGFLTADDVFALDPDRDLLSVSEYEALKASFVQEWAADELDETLDEEQARAVALFGGDIRVVARAGSGKTRTLVTRAIFLVKHCRVDPRSVMLLAFNRAAAAEMRERLENRMGDARPHVMTFHALAYALVHPQGPIAHDDAAVGTLGLSREVQEVIDEHIGSQEYGPLVRDLMLRHFRGDWERLVQGDSEKNKDEFLAYRRTLLQETLSGDYVQSYGEKLIANTLFEHGVSYQYERSFRWSGVSYRPDFTIFHSGRAGGIVIEYFGLAGDAAYDAQSVDKREFWEKRPDWTLLEYVPADVAQGESAFADQLLGALAEAGIASARRTETEIWDLVRRRAIDGFTSVVRSFVSRCRTLGLTTDEVNTLVQGHDPATETEEIFLRIGLSVHESYHRRLIETGQEDFDGLMCRAIAAINHGQTRFARAKGREQGDLAALRYILIDEFQDFSRLFYELVQGIRNGADDVEFFCVGDDWQAINGFAGSDLRYFEAFDEHFRNPRTTELRTNYRSASAVVDVGNALMAGRGPTAEPGVPDQGAVWLCDLARHTPTTIERREHNGDELTPAVLRLVQHYLGAGQDVVLLARTNRLGWYVDLAHYTRIPSELDRYLAHVRRYLPKDVQGRVTISTTHKYKGRERPAVIVLDALRGRYPLIHPTWLFLRVFGDDLDILEAEERRLLYVAITRARSSLAIVTEGLRASPFLQDIGRCPTLAHAPWDSLPPVFSAEGTMLEVRVSNGFSMKEDLKQAGFSFDGHDKCWITTIPAADFSPETIRTSKWYRGPVRIRVLNEAGELIYRDD